MAKIGGSVRVPGLYYLPQTNLQLVEHLESYLVVDGSGRLDALDTGGRAARPIYKIKLNDVPKPLGALIEQISATAGAYDAVPGSQHGEDVHGSMRDVHQNNDKGTRYLPVHTYPVADGMAGKALAYHNYIVEHGKAHVQNRQRSNSGVTNELTGYIEYTVKIGECSQLRLIYDYLDGRYFFSPNHYKPWARNEALKGSKAFPRYRLAPQEIGLSKEAWEDAELYGPHLLIDV